QRRDRGRSADPIDELTQAGPESPPENHRHRGEQHHPDIDRHHVSDGEPHPRCRGHATFSSRFAARPPTTRKATRTLNEMTNSTMDIAAAPVRSSFSIKARIHWEDTSVLPGTAPPIVTTEPNSPMHRENARPAPVNRAGVSDGSTME